jgi:hypothetical protein
VCIAALADPKFAMWFCLFLCILFLLGTAFMWIFPDWMQDWSLYKKSPKTYLIFSIIFSSPFFGLFIYSLVMLIRAIKWYYEDKKTATSTN